MPPRRREPTPDNSEALILTMGNDELHVRNFEELNETERLIEQDVHELNALALFGAINRKEFILAHPDTLKKQGGNAARSLTSIKEQRDELVAQARTHFEMSAGYDHRRVQLVAANQPTDELDREAKRAWNTFQIWYRKPQSADARTRRIRELRTEVKYLRSNENRDQGLRPHLSDGERKLALEPVLDTRERLIALRDDPRARFMPTTHREKNVMLAWLDYLDNPDYPLGINNQLLEVFNHQAGRGVTSETYAKRELPDRTVRTIVYELHDYWTNANISLATLTDLEKVVDECVNPNVTLAEEAGDHPGLRALIRFRDLERWREQDKKPKGVRDPLVTKEDRRPHTDDQKNKTVEDIYTRRVADPEIMEYIAEEADGITIKEARGLIQRAVADQENRQLFLLRRLEDIASPREQQRYRSAAQLAGRLVTTNRIAPLEQTA
ncbi:MAG TPA: hypothetical protein VGE30_01460 [Candidatus Saccharimonadales bacterium]